MKKFSFLRVLALVLVLAMFTSLMPVTAVDAIKDALVSDAITEVVSEEPIIESTPAPEESIEETAIPTKEVTGKREENVKHFLMSDGSYVAAQYPFDVHYCENGEMLDIDNTIIESNSNPEVAYENTSNSLDVSLSKKANSDALISVGNDKYNISWKYLPTTGKAISDEVVGVVAPKEKEDDDMMTLSNISSEITYYNIEENIDLQYLMISNFLKENIIVNKQRDSYEFNFSLNITNLKPVMQEDGSIQFLSEETGEMQYVMPAPFMIDSGLR